MTIEEQLARTTESGVRDISSARQELFRRAMPLHAACEGTWEGVYTELNAAGHVENRHQSRLTCTYKADHNADFLQTNTYTYAGGRQESHDFSGVLNMGRIWWNTDRVFGCAYEAGDGQTALVTWTRKDIIGSQMFEMVQFNKSMTERHRVWQWFEADRLVKRVIIDERSTN